MKKRISIIGSGAMATAMAKVLFDSGNKDIRVFGINDEELKELSQGMNTKYFPNSTQLPSLETYNEMDDAVKGSDYVVFAVPSKVMDVTLEAVLKEIDREVVLINVAKGFYPGTTLSLHEGIKAATKEDKRIRGVVSIIGPSHAEEIVKGIPTAVSVVDKDKKLCAEVQGLFNNDYFRTYIQQDVKGAEVGAAYKNVLAIASGIANGLGFGINTTAALLTRGLAEMQRFNKVMKGKQSTIMGLTGIGDLIVTATSDLSRNYTFGKTLAIEGVKKALASNITIEGLTSLDVIYKIGKDKNIELPIVNNLYKVIHDEIDPSKVVKDLFKRELRTE
ncbi:MAG: NAD(P)H-dependent glycerol-3-phosphate dehydrogenase [Mycoplasmataceae bacterium]|nr:NAD(P)H-dependent glycerol-3-phosphate dehydrogenase [Mycoplasmataceae bacterium]